MKEGKTKEGRGGGEGREREMRGEGGEGKGDERGGRQSEGGEYEANHAALLHAIYVYELANTSHGS